VSEHLDADDVKKLAKQTRKSQLEQRFLEAWRRNFPNLPTPTMQHRFHDLRKWRFDFAFVSERLAIEIDGGAFVGGGHNRGAQQSKDYEKMNVATAGGWRVLRFNTASMKYVDDVVTFVAEVLTQAKDVA
jgi:very-short-patch-repair endonuclease